LFPWQLIQIGDLIRGEIPLRYFFACEVRPNHFDINPEFTLASDSDNRESMRMRKVKTKGMPRAGAGYRGLAARAIHEIDHLRCTLKVSAEHIAKNSTRGDEVIAIRVKDKPLCALQLVLR
jgi:hypothetical protein